MVLLECSMKVLVSKGTRPSAAAPPVVGPHAVVPPPASVALVAPSSAPAAPAPTVGPPTAVPPPTLAGVLAPAPDAPYVVGPPAAMPPPALTSLVGMTYWILVSSWGCLGEKMLLTMGIHQLNFRSDVGVQGKTAASMVPTLLDKQGAQLLAVVLLVVSRTWISDRIASLNGYGPSMMLLGFDFMQRWGMYRTLRCRGLLLRPLVTSRLVLMGRRSATPTTRSYG
ncbi:hypothetical protein Taro_025039, partial [Colocasia esculenta]|nr:hypothetical protein [Colocasia esculenta]